MVFAERLRIAFGENASDRYRRGHSLGVPLSCLVSRKAGSRAVARNDSGGLGIGISGYRVIGVSIGSHSERLVEKKDFHRMSDKGGEMTQGLRENGTQSPESPSSHVIARDRKFEKRFPQDVAKQG